MITTSGLRTLERLLREECAAYEQYSKLASAESSSIVQLEPDKVDNLANQREALLERMAEFKEERLQLMKQEGAGERSLTHFVERQCRPADQRVLMPLVKRLKEAVGGVRTQTQELGRLTNFALNMVNGSLAVMWSAAAARPPAYSQHGTLRGPQPPAAQQRSALSRSA